MRIRDNGTTGDLIVEARKCNVNTPGDNVRRLSLIYMYQLSELPFSKDQKRFL